MKRERWREVKIKIAPAIMDADLGHLADAIAELEEAGADLLHVDVMDGHFVPAFVGGTRVVAAVKRNATIPVGVHLMVANPDQAVPWFLDAGADTVFFHPEATDDAAEVVRRIQRAGRMAGLALKPEVPARFIEHVAAELDCIVAMTVNPGFSGQGFIESGCAKIPALRRMCKPGIDIYVDGGINPETAPVAIRYGANVLAVASAVFAADVSPGEAVKRLRRIAENVSRAKD